MENNRQGRGILTKDEVMAVLRKEMPYLREHFHVDEIALFGSYARGDADGKSDIDILVTFSKTPGMITFMKCENHLADRFGMKIDLVLKSALRPHIAETVLQEALYI